MTAALSRLKALSAGPSRPFAPTLELKRRAAALRKTGSADEARAAVRRPSIVSLVLRVVVGAEMWCAGVLGALARVSLGVREVDGFGFDRGGVPEEFDDQPLAGDAML